MLNIDCLIIGFIAAGMLIVLTFIYFSFFAIKKIQFSRVLYDHLCNNEELLLNFDLGAYALYNSGEALFIP